MALHFNKKISVGSKASMHLNTPGLTASFPKESILNNLFGRASSSKFPRLSNFLKSKNSTTFFEISVMLIMAAIIIVFGAALAVGKLILMFVNKS
jgi:hypothetical protein